MTNRELYIKQKNLLDMFLSKNAISKAQYDKSLSDLTVKMGMQDIPLEIERKYLIEYPNIKWLEGRDGIRKVEITQYYFDTPQDKKLRIRSWRENNTTRYILTRKTRINDMVRFEEESEIDKEEYDALLRAASGDPESSNLRKIVKIRFCLPHEGKIIEIDIFPFWKDRALAEVELDNEKEEVALPDEIKVIREVTEEKEFTNYNLAEKCR